MRGRSLVIWSTCLQENPGFMWLYPVTRTHLSWAILQMFDVALHNDRLSMQRYNAP
jgi:hypothetical protein